jgi:hypothetical protein
MQKLVILFCLFFLSKVQAQIPALSIKGCQVFKNLQYKNGRDTVVIKATFREIDKFAGNDRLNELIKLKSVGADDFDYQIGFIPENCSETYFAPAKEKRINSMLKSLKSDPEIYLTCVVFEKHEWEYQGVPFFVIIKASANNAK